MRDTIMSVFDWMGIQPIAFVIGIFVAWRLYKQIGLKWFIALLICIVGSTFFIPAKIVKNDVLVIGGLYVVIQVFMFVLGGGALGSSNSVSGSTSSSSTQYPEMDIPFGAPPGFNPYVQRPGSHAFGYKPEQDPDHDRWSA